MSEIAEALMLSCEQYDYIEIACLYRYRVQVILKSEEQFIGQALDIVFNPSKQECIKLSDIQCKQQRLIKLADINKIRVLNKGAKFSELVLS